MKVKLSVAPERSHDDPHHQEQPGRGNVSADYSGVPANLTFGATDTEKTITFAAASDNVDDDNESITLGFGDIPHVASPREPPAQRRSASRTTTCRQRDGELRGRHVQRGRNRRCTSTTMVKENEATVTVTLSADP